MTSDLKVARDSSKNLTMTDGTRKSFLWVSFIVSYLRAGNCCRNFRNNVKLNRMPDATECRVCLFPFCFLTLGMLFFTLVFGFSYLCSSRKLKWRKKRQRLNSDWLFVWKLRFYQFILQGLNHSFSCIVSVHPHVNFLTTCIVRVKREEVNLLK